MNLSEKQLERYSRHIILPEVGIKGQSAILNGKVLIIGIGGLGSPAALYLAAAGVGTIGLIDGDNVDLSNLQRQVIHSTPDLGKPKVISAKEKIQKINPDVDVIIYQKIITPENITDIIKDYDFIIEATDNFPAKFLINDACVLSQKPFSHGGVLRFDGQTMTYVPGNSCYRCIFDSPPSENAASSCSQSQSCSEAGVLAVIPGIIGTIQATETLKFLINKGELLTNKLLMFNALNMDFRTVNFNRNTECPICGDKPRITELEIRT